MAVSTTSSFLFLLFLVSSLTIHAREVRESNFNKAVRENNLNNPETVEKNLPSPKEDDPTTTTFSPQDQNGYGLYGGAGYGPGGYQYPTPPFTPITNYNAEYNSPNDFQSKYPNGEFNNNKETKYENKDSTLYSNPQYSNNRQGMSDTRFVENGKYFYNVNAERQGNGYGSGNNMGFGSTRYSNDDMRSGSRQADSTNKYNNYNNNNYYSNNYNPNNEAYRRNEFPYEYNGAQNRFQNQQETEEDFEP